MFLGYGGDKDFIVKSYVDTSFDMTWMTLSLNLGTY